MFSIFVIIKTWFHGILYKILLVQSVCLCSTYLVIVFIGCRLVETKCIIFLVQIHAILMRHETMKTMVTTYFLNFWTDYLIIWMIVSKNETYEVRGQKKTEYAIVRKGQKVVSIRIDAIVISRTFYVSFLLSSIHSLFSFLFVSSAY